MKNKNYTPQRLVENRWLRFGYSITLAFGLALILWLLPVTAGTVIHVPVPTLPQLEPVMGSLPLKSNQAAGRTIDLPLPFGASLVQATNGLTITKIAPEFVDQGGTLTYTLIVTNQTGEAITAAKVIDSIPITGATCLDILGPSPPPLWLNNACGSDNAVWKLLYNVWPVPFADGTTSVFTFSVIIDQPLPDLFEIINDGYTITGTTSTSVYTDAGSPITTRVYAPNWVISKTVSSDTIQPGEYLTYTITITNNGHLRTSGPYTITDVLPTNTVSTSVISQPPATLNGLTLTWVFTDADLAVGESRSATYSIQVTSPLTDGEKIVNQTYTITGGNVFSAAVGAPITTTVASTASLVITKTASPDPVQAGDLLTYTITITNDAATSRGPAFSVIISDTLPGEVITQSAGFVGPATGVVTDTTNPILWELSNPLAVGASVQVTVTVRVTSPLLPGFITNTFAASARNAALVSDTITTEVTSTNIITLSKSVTPTLVVPGGTVTYTITLTNSGNSMATINLTDVLHPDFSPPVYNQSGLSLPGRTLSTSGTVTTAVFTATAPITPGFYYNRAITATYDLTQATISNIAPVQVVSAVITMTKIANVSLANMGETITYTYTITNAGNITLTNITLTDNVLGIITPATTTLGPTASTTGTATTLVTEADLPGPITNTATVTGTYLIDNFTSATTTETVAITYTTLITVDKLATPSAGLPANIGDTITYTYRITNTGTVTLYTITLADDRLGPISVVSTTLMPGQSTEVTRSIVVAESHLPGPITNTATVTGINILSETTTATDTVIVPVTYTTRITVDKLATPSAGLPANIGDTITYTYRITNTGTVTLSSITLTDDRLGPIAVSPSTLAPGQSTEVTRTIVVTESHLPGPITNMATVTGTNLLSENDVATDTVSVPITYTTGISLEKTASTATATIDEVIVYTYRLTNTGTVSLTNITLTDDKLGPITSLLSLPPGATTVLTSYTVVQSDFTAWPQSLLANTATVTGTDFTPAVVTDTDTVTVTLVYTPEIRLLKTVNDAVVAPDQIITYTYYITNTGNVTLTNITLTDDRLGPITLTITTLSPNGGATTGTVTYTVQAGDVPVITNTAIVTGNDILNRPITDTKTLTVSVEAIITAITATNSSPTAVHSPTYFTVTTSITNGVTYTWYFGDGSSTETGQTPVHTYTTVGTYTAVITASNGVSTISTTTVVTITPGPVAGFVLTAATPQTAGVSFPITITAVDAYNNLVDTFNQSVTISDTTGTIAPTAVTLVNGITVTNFTVYSATSPALDTIWAISGTITGTTGVEIRPNVPTTVTVVAFPTSGLRVCQSAAVTATVVDNWNNVVPNTPMQMFVDNAFPLPPGAPYGNAIITPTTFLTTNASGMINAYVQGTGAGNVSVGAGVLPSGVPADQTDIGNDINFANPPIPSAITVTVAPSSVFTAGTAIVTATVSSCVGPANGVTVTFSIPGVYGSLNPVTATTNASGIATTTVTAGSTPGTTLITGTVEGPRSDDTPFTILPASAPVLTITKTATPPSGNDVQPGSTIVYQLLVSNNGTATATNVVITDALDTDVGFVIGSIVPTGNGPVDNGGGVITFSVSSLGIGASVTATIQVTVTASVSGAVVTNTATASSDQTGNVGNSNMTIHRVITVPTTPAGPIYLPIVLKNFSGPPPCANLQVTDLTVMPGNVIRVTVVNTGTCATDSGFWVDLYANPATLPGTLVGVTADRAWNSPYVNATHGMAWAVSGLGAGSSITLLSDGSVAPAPEDKNWPPSGSVTLYAYADSFDNNDPNNALYVEIPESDEYDNQFGPVGAIFPAGLESGSTAPPESRTRPDLD
jgi:uncharacterized repeat protein (TIGR01451 family)